ncbi:MAG: DNA-protecting protein DprA [Fusobacterium sp.]|nr:DNA-protecting protein DprA [Fusobacterium sp.]
MYSKKDLIKFSILNTYSKEINYNFLYELFKISNEKEINIFKNYENNFESLKEFLEKKKLEKFLEIFDKDLIKKLKTETDEILEICKENNIKILSYNEKKYFEKLKKIKNPPFVIYYKGKLPTEKKLEKAVALVGKRKISSVGENFTREMGRYLKENKIFNVSGLALGTDKIGHIETLSFTGAVLGQGLAREIYPRENKKLAEKILENNGFLLSELPLLENISALNLIRRNRLQSALAERIIIAETGIKGGTVHTFKFAREQKKEIYIAEHNKDFIEKYRKDLIVIKDFRDFEEKIKKIKKQSKIKF